MQQKCDMTLGNQQNTIKDKKGKEEEEEEAKYAMIFIHQMENIPKFLQIC